MTRLIAPIGHSRLNLLAAIERVKPDEVLIILGKEIHQITELTVRTAASNSKLIVDVIACSILFPMKRTNPVPLLSLPAILPPRFHRLKYLLVNEKQFSVHRDNLEIFSPNNSR
ncbi:MAG TPA: hypothetical protein EYQ73_04070 [Candidatus Poseidoniales archaeon]|nr:hypothetical protein [Candidatus Poseidoniales archaeon]